jgi:hypothetical protein
MSRFTTTLPTRASSVLSAALLFAGCAAYGPGDLKPGQSEADVRARMGEPTDRSALADGGLRLDYARGPMGAHTYRFDLDASGRVQAVSQLLTEANFETVRSGQAKADVRERLGRASETRVGWRGVGEVWSYRYDYRFLCRWFQVWLVEDRVREAAYAPDPICDEEKLFRRD